MSSCRASSSRTRRIEGSDADQPERRATLEPDHGGRSQPPLTLPGVVVLLGLFGLGGPSVVVGFGPGLLGAVPGGVFESVVGDAIEPVVPVGVAD